MPPGGLSHRADAATPPLRPRAPAGPVGTSAARGILFDAIGVRRDRRFDGTISSRLPSHAGDHQLRPAQQFGGRLDVVGRIARADGVTTPPCAPGVMPQSFSYPSNGRQPHVRCAHHYARSATTTRGNGRSSRVPGTVSFPHRQAFDAVMDAGADKRQSRRNGGAGQPITSRSSRLAPGWMYGAAIDGFGKCWPWRSAGPAGVRQRLGLVACVASIGRATRRASRHRRRDYEPCRECPRRVRCRRQRSPDGRRARRTADAVCSPRHAAEPCLRRAGVRCASSSSPARHA